MSFTSQNLFSSSMNSVKTPNDLFKKEDKESILDQESQNNTYYIYWPIQKRTYNLASQFFVDKTQSFTESISIPVDNLKDIKFKLEWKDDVTTPIFKFGKDQLYFSIFSPDGVELYSKTSFGEGILRYSINDINMKPLIDEASAENMSEANKIIAQHNGTKWKNEPIQVVVKIRIGEIGLLRKFFDKGNNFRLEISYEYYKLELSDKKDNPPETNIILNPPVLINKNTAVLSWSASDDFTDTDEMEYSYKFLEDDAWSSWSKESSVTLNGLKNGEYVFLVRAKDHRGNIDLSPAQHSFVVKIDKDVVNPDTILSGGPVGEIDYDDVTFQWNGIDDKTLSENLYYSYMLIGKDSSWSYWSKSTIKTYVNLENGEYVFKVKSKDATGNVDLTPAEQTFEVKTDPGDLVFPNTEIISGPMGSVDYNSVVFIWTGSDDETQLQNLQYSYKLINYDSKWSDFRQVTSTSYDSLENGVYTFKVRAKDAAGNVDLSPAEQTFNVNVELGPNRFITNVIELNFGENPHASYMDPLKVLGGPKGLGRNEGSLDVLSLGTNGSIILGFDVIITNGPGKDFIVFENPLYKYGSDKIFAELMYVEVSTDGLSFARFPSISATLNPGIVDPNDVINLAGVMPVYANVEKNDIDPFDPLVAGGDAFDLDSLIDHLLVLSGQVDLDNINFIRLIDIKGDGSCKDSENNPIYDPTDMDNGADLDAIAIINYKD